MKKAAWMVGMTGLLLGSLVGCGADKKEDEDSTDKKLTFADDVNPLLKANCSGSTCHDSTGTGTRYVDQESAFKNSSAVSQLNAKLMPKPPNTISDADKQKLLDFLAQ